MHKQKNEKVTDGTKNRTLRSLLREVKITSSNQTVNSNAAMCTTQN